MVALCGGVAAAGICTVAAGVAWEATGSSAGRLAPELIVALGWETMGVAATAEAAAALTAATAAPRIGAVVTVLVHGVAKANAAFAGRALDTAQEEAALAIGATMGDGKVAVGERTSWAITGGAPCSSQGIDGRIVALSREPRFAATIASDPGGSA